MNDLSLAELRVKYPTIKSTSKKGFLNQIPNEASSHSKPSEGVGDTIEKIAKKTGIKKVVGWIAGKDCGCQERKDKLNRIFRYKAECMIQSEYEWFKQYKKRHNPKNYSKEDVHTLVMTFTRIFKRRPSVCSNCNGAVKVMGDIYEALNNIYETY